MTMSSRTIDNDSVIKQTPDGRVYHVHWTRGSACRVQVPSKEEGEPVGSPSVILVVSWWLQVTPIQDRGQLVTEPSFFTEIEGTGTG